MAKRNEEHRVKFGAYMNQGIKLVGALQEKSVAEIEEELSHVCGRTIKAIQSYRQGTIPPDTVLMKVVQYFVKEAAVERSWIEGLLQAIEYPDVENATNALFPEHPVIAPLATVEKAQPLVAVPSATPKNSTRSALTKSSFPILPARLRPFLSIGVGLVFMLAVLIGVPAYRQWNLQDGRLLLDGGFEKTNDVGHWRNVGGCKMAVKEGESREGQHYLEVVNQAPCISFSQDVQITPVLHRTYTFSAWFRSPENAYPRASLVIWGGRLIFNQFNDLEKGDAGFQIKSGEWQCIAATINVSNPDTTRLRAEVYLDGFDGQTYQVDDVRFTEGDENPCPETIPQLYNGSFEEQAIAVPPWQTNGTCEIAALPQGAGAHDGTAVMSITKGRDCSSVYQIIDIEAELGETYNFAIWVQSPDGTERTTEAVIWARGDTTEKSQRFRTIQGNEWQCIESTLRTEQKGPIELVLEVYLHTSAEFRFDDARFQIGVERQCPEPTLQIANLHLPFGVRADYYSGEAIPIVAEITNGGVRESENIAIQYWIASQIHAEGLEARDANNIPRPSIFTFTNGTLIKDEDAVFVPVNIPPGNYYVVAELVESGYRYTIPEQITIRRCESPAGQYYCDVPAEHWANAGIQSWAEAGISNGCRSGTEPYFNRPFCPRYNVDNWAIAVLLSKYLKGADFQPSEPFSPYYTDNFADDRARWVFDFFHLNGLELQPKGCLSSPESPKICPYQIVTRGDLARYLAMVLQWDLTEVSTTPPSGFVDLPEDEATRQAILYMEQQGFLAFNEPDCLPSNGQRRFCPDAPLRRANAAAILTRVFEDSIIPDYP